MASSLKPASLPLPEDVIYEFGPFRLDPGSYRLTMSNETLPLRAKAFDLLVVLVSRAGRIVEKDDLMALVWPKLIVEDNNLTVLMAALRRTLGDNRNDLKYIVTLPGRGYRFAAPVTSVARETESPTASPVPPDLTSEVLAILPFKTLSNNLSSYLELGLPDVLASRLSRLPNVVVRPTHSTARYHNQAIEAAVVGRELRADMLITGSIQRTEDRFRVSIQLVNTELGAMIWGEEFDEPAADLFDLEDRVAERVAVALTRRLTAAERARFRTRPTLSPEAYRAYVRGRSLWSRRTRESLLLAIESLKTAVSSDANYTDAFSALADCYNVLSLYSDAMPIECSSNAKKFALRALTLDANSAQARTSLAYAHYLAYEWEEAGESFRAALDLDTGYSVAHHWYSNYLAAQGDLQTALLHARKALELDPASANTSENLGHILYFAGQHDEAAAQLVRALELDPHFTPAHCYLGLVYLRRGLIDDAVVQCQRAVDIAPDNPDFKASLAHCLAAAGRPDLVQSILEGLMTADSTMFAAADSIAFVHAALRNTNDAFAWLIRGVAERSCRLRYLRVSPLVDSLRGDPRFERVLERAGLSQSPPSAQRQTKPA